MRDLTPAFSPLGFADRRGMVLAILLPRPRGLAHRHRPQAGSVIQVMLVDTRSSVTRESYGFFQDAPAAEHYWYTTPCFVWWFQRGAAKKVQYSPPPEGEGRPISSPTTREFRALSY